MSEISVNMSRMNLNELKDHSKDIMRNNQSFEKVKLNENPEGHVLVLYTGGTIGMIRNQNGGEFKKHFSTDNLKINNQINQILWIKPIITLNLSNLLTMLNENYNIQSINRVNKCKSKISECFQFKG